LATEKSPTLCWVIPSFTVMITSYKWMIVKHLHLATAAQVGSDKPTDYYQHIQEIPAYVLAMGVSFSSEFKTYLDS
ncbi:hypothetical protein GYMLUDRAFT_167407, partial [Collybiopsis luxurians FD-317 M1]